MAQIAAKSNKKTGLDFCDKKRKRLNLGKTQKEVLEVPFLLQTQIESYKHFLQADVLPEKRLNEGLHGAFQSVFPIESYSGHMRLEYLFYMLGEPAFDVHECRTRGVTYAAPLRVTMRLIVN